MLETVFNQQIRNQRPYYLPVGQPIKGIDGRYWLVFVHRDAEDTTVVKRFFKRLVNGKQATHKLLPSR